MATKTKSPFCDTIATREFEAGRSLVWPLHDIAMINIGWCMAYQRGFGGGVVYCAIVVPWYCNSVGNAAGGAIKEGLICAQKP